MTDYFRVGNIAQLVLTLFKALCLTPESQKPDMMAHTWSPGTQQHPRCSRNPLELATISAT